MGRMAVSAVCSHMSSGIKSHLVGESGAMVQVSVALYSSSSARYLQQLLCL